MKVGLSLFGELLSEDGARFAAQAGASHVVAHLVDYARGADNAACLAGEVGPMLGDCSNARLWSYVEMAGLVAMLRRHGLELAAIENFSPNFWSDVLLDGPRRREQMEGLKRLVRDAGRAGVPCIGYNFSIAGVWGWRRRPIARGGAVTVEFDPPPSTTTGRSRPGRSGTCATARGGRTRRRCAPPTPSSGSGSAGSWKSSCRSPRRRA
jgi:mannonate dehydratase